MSANSCVVLYVPPLSELTEYIYSCCLSCLFFYVVLLVRLGFGGKYGSARGDERCGVLQPFFIILLWGFILERDFYLFYTCNMRAYRDSIGGWWFRYQGRGGL